MMDNKTIIVTDWEDLCPWLSKALNESEGNRKVIKRTLKALKGFTYLFVFKIISDYLGDRVYEKYVDRRLNKLEKRLNAIEEDTE